MCDHLRTEIIARREGVDYLECLECRQVFEADDLEPVPALDELDDDEPLTRPRVVGLTHKTR